MKKPNLADPVSKYISSASTVVRAEQTVAEALDSLRKRRFEGSIFYFYVVDDEDKLVGVISTRALLLSDQDRPVREAMDEHVVSIPDTMTLGDALEFFAMHRLLAFPVVDNDNRLLGIVDVHLYTDEVFGLAASHRVSDLYQMVGFTVEQARQPTPMASFKVRMPWLFCNMAAGIACAVIGLIFERTLDEIVVLAMFIPLVLTLSESVSMQSVTLSFQFLHRPDVQWDAVWRRLRLEVGTAVMLGLASGVLIGIVALLWGPGYGPAGIIGISIIISMFFCALAGLSIPIALHLFCLDPRIASGPVVLMVADTLTTAVYLGLATWMLM